MKTISNTQKEIIELLEPWMDKTLSEGCLFIDEFGYLQKIYKYTGEENRYEVMSGQSRLIYEGDELVKILGHYDLSALEGYLYEKDVELMDIREGQRIYIDSEFKEFRIPNKPPYLYSDEENEFLLLKLKLGTL